MSWNHWVLGNEASLRLGAFVAVLVLMAVWERLSPRRAWTVSRRLRWASNLGLVVLNSLALRLLFPVASVGIASWAQQRDWGLFHLRPLPPGVMLVLSVIALDFVIWLQHVMFHAIPALWRLHRVHHADLDYDVTTGIRFHPFEIILSQLVKWAAIALLGPPLVAVVLFEVLLNASAMFNHGNVGLPAGLDRVLRWLLVTPDMHRVHHSVEEDEANSNFGFSLSWWDRLFGTYREQPRAGHRGMTIGICGYRNPKRVARLPGMLALPFAGPVRGYAINHRQRRCPDED